MKRFKEIKTYYRNFSAEETGAVIVIVALLLVVLLSITSFAVDLGVVYYQKSKLQTAMDAAALAAVHEMPDQGAARAKALEFVIKNGYNVDDVEVTFPTNDSVRVSKSTQQKTTFANLFHVDMVNIKQYATAKLVSKSTSCNFDYLMFAGSPDCTITLGAVFKLNGSMHANHKYNLQGATAGGVCYVSGAVEGCNGGSIPNGPTDNNRCWVGQEVADADWIDMPDFSQVLLDIAPQLPNEYLMHGFIVPAYSTNLSGGGPIFDNGWTNYYVYPIPVTFKSNYNTWTGICVYGNAYFKYGCGSLGWNSDIAGDIYCNGNFSKGSGSFFVGGDLCVDGNLTISSTSAMNNHSPYTSYIGGDIYVDGSFTLGGGGIMYVGGNIYVNGDVNFSGKCVVQGDIIANGKATFGQQVTCSGDIRSVGDMRYGGQNPCVTLNGGVIYSSAGSIQFTQGFTIDGCVYAYGDINCGGMPNFIDSNSATLSVYSQTGDINFYAASTAIYGMVYAPQGTVTIAGNTCEYYGSIIADKIGGSIPARLIMGENTRDLPYSKKVKVAALIE